MLFTLRLLPYSKAWARRIIYVAFVLNFAITSIACVCYGVKCTPFRAAYADVPGAKCSSETVLIASQTVNGGRSSPLNSDGLSSTFPPQWLPTQFCLPTLQS